MADGVVKRGLLRLLLLVLFTFMANSPFQIFAQGTMSNPISKEDKTEIIKSILQLTQSSVFTRFTSIKYLSLENIEFIAPTLISDPGFVLLSYSQIEELKKEHVIEYVIFRSIDMESEKVIVTLSRMTEGRPCFAPAFSSEQKIKYEYSKESGQWKGELIRQLFPSPFLYDQILNIKQSTYIWTKPDKSISRTRN
jgi:hypothetical protein